MRIDLHCHSTHSDGSFPAARVAEMAFAREVSLFCLSDHDTCDGYQATLAAYPKAIRGVELSCVYEERTVHLLMYQRRSDQARWAVVEEALKEQQEVRRTRVHLIAERLADLGVTLDAADLVERHKGTIGRPHIAARLVETGAVGSQAEAFDRYLKDGGPGDVQVARLSLAQGLELGRAGGACMSLAHPHVYGSRAESILRAHKPLGLQGLEVYYAQYKAKKRKNWSALALELGLLQTGGSDFHGQTLPQVPCLGVDMPDELVKPLLDWLEIPGAEF